MSAFMLQKTRTLSVASGKGGVGKTLLVANLAQCLANKGKRVLIFDGDLGLASVDLQFGLKSQSQLLDVITREKSVSEVVFPLTPMIDLVSGGNGVAEMTRLSSFQRRTILDSMSQINRTYDYLLIDTGPGISDSVMDLSSAAQMVVVLITPDPASFADAYATIKVLHQEKKEKRFAIVCNMVRDDVDGMVLYQKFADVVQRFLMVSLDYWGGIPFDSAVKKSVINQRLIVRQDPNGLAAMSIGQISGKVEQALQRTEQKAGLQFFWEQVVGVA